MTTKSKNFKVEPGFEELFSFSSEEEKIEHRAQMISYRILSEVEKVCEERKIKMKDLAGMIGTSASYVTQLFRGNRQVNTSVMAKIEEAVDMVFNISLRNELVQQEEMERLTAGIKLLKGLVIKNPEMTYYCAIPGRKPDTVKYLSAFDENEEVELTQKQIA